MAPDGRQRQHLDLARTMPPCLRAMAQGARETASNSAWANSQTGDPHAGPRPRIPLVRLFPGQRRRQTSPGAPGCAFASQTGLSTST